jgi:hypothetical protein
MQQILSSLVFAGLSLAAFPPSVQAEESTTASPLTNHLPNSTPPSSSQHRWHLPRSGARNITHEATRPHDPDWNPLASPLWDLKDALKKVGITTDSEIAFFAESSSKVLSGTNNFATFSWESSGDWELLPDTAWGKSYVFWSGFGSVGLNYDPQREFVDGAIGSISIPNNTVYNNPAVIDELYWKQVSPSGNFVVLAGKVDMLNYFDTSRIANDSFNQFYAGSLSNKLSLPAPLYGGFGGLVRAQLSKKVHLMAAMGDSSSNNAVAPWKSLENDSWYQLLELGVTMNLPGLGKGQYSIIPWHNHLFGKDGWGFGFNLDQELGNEDLLAFFRFGLGEKEVTPVKRFLSGGLAYNAPFGRSKDTLALGVSWAAPSPGVGRQNETLIETYYRLSLSPSIALTPDLQVIFDPALAPDNRTVVIGGLRLTMQF